MVRRQERRPNPDLPQRWLRLNQEPGPEGGENQHPGEQASHKSRKHPYHPETRFSTIHCCKCVQKYLECLSKIVFTIFKFLFCYYNVLLRSAHNLVAGTQFGAAAGKINVIACRIIFDLVRMNRCYFFLLMIQIIVSLLPPEAQCFSFGFFFGGGGFRKWKTNSKRYSESSSHSGTASSSRTAGSPDLKSRSPKLPCKRQRPFPGLLGVFLGVSCGQILKIRLHRAWFPSHSVETKPTFQDRLCFCSLVIPFHTLP